MWERVGSRKRGQIKREIRTAERGKKQETQSKRERHMRRGNIEIPAIVSVCVRDGEEEWGFNRQRRNTNRHVKQ